MMVGGEVVNVLVAARENCLDGIGSANIQILLAYTINFPTARREERGKQGAVLTVSPYDESTTHLPTISMDGRGNSIFPPSRI